MFEVFSRPTFRSALSQLCGIFPYYCLKFVYGSVLGFQIILLAELYKKDSDMRMSIDQLTWLASLTFLTPLGSLSTGFSAQRLGSRTVALATAFMYIASFLLHYNSTSATMTFAGQVFSKLTGIYTLSTPYISEISEPRFRSKFFAVGQLAKAFGTLFSLLLGNFMSWRMIALVNLTFPIVAAVSVLAIPNSPAWLASKGRLDEAERSLCWLRGWVQPHEVQTEFRALVDESKSSLGDQQLGWQARSRAFLQLFLKRSFYLPLGTVCMIFFLHEVDGVTVVHSYSKIVLPKIDSPIDASVASVVMEATRILGNLTILVLIRRTGKRKLAFCTLVVFALCHASIATVGFLKLHDTYLWVPPIAIIIANFASTAGVGTIVYMLLSEVFPSSVRYVGTAIGLSFDSIVTSLVNKLFLYVVEAISLPGTFLFFVLMNVIALFAYYFLIPETEGRSLTEIEDHFKKGKKPSQVIFC